MVSSSTDVYLYVMNRFASRGKTEQRKAAHDGQGRIRESAACVCEEKL
jgi:hypothetical protein